MKNIFQLLISSFMLMALVNCGGGGNSISTLATSDSFDDGNLDFNPKMDILWVVDPSKSMFEEVEKVRNNISIFMESFVALGYEYRVGVISSAAWSDEAYLADTVLLNYLYSGGPVFADLHRGQCIDRANLNPGYLDPENTTNFGDFLVKFSRNFDVYGVDAGTSGCGIVGPPFAIGYPQVANNFFENSNGYDSTTREAINGYINDERPLQSVRAFLERDKLKSPSTRFVRDDAHLAIIIVTDEPDASRDDLSPSPAFNPSNPLNHTAAQYVDYLTIAKGSISNFSVYSIVDNAHTVNISKDIASLSGGLSFDINATQEEYVTNLGQISSAILVSSSYFPIAHRPIPSTIRIQVVKENGTVVDVPASGFTYIAAQQGVTINAEYLPAQGDSLKINYTPAQLISGVSEQPRLSLSNLAIPERPAFAGSSPNPGDSGYDADTYTKNGSTLGTVSLLYNDSTGGTFSIIDSNPAGAYAIDATTGQITVANAALFDTETRGRHRLEVSLSLPDVADAYTRTFLISVTDIADSVAVAVADSYTISESIVDELGVIRVYGNLSYNDTGVDSSESHTWEKVSDPSGSITGPVGSIVVNANGAFTYTVNAAALNDGDGLGATDHEIISFSYRIVGTPSNPANTSNTVVSTIRINGFNQAPELYNPINDVTVEFSGGLMKIPLVAADVTASGFANGDAANLVDGSGSTLSRTSGANAHFININFPSSSIWEVDRFEIDGNHSLGNSVFQVRSGTKVLTREVLPVNQGNDLTINMTQKVIGGGVRILRPHGATNTAGHQYIELNEVSVFGIEAETETIDLSDHFRDLDFGDSITYYATDEFGEGPAPGWATVSGDILTLLPGSGANANIGILAQDTGGATAFTVFNVRRIGAGSGATNGPPIATLPLDDEKRGGITLRRFGGGSEVSSNPQTDNSIRHGEGDNFIINPYAGQAIRDALTGQTPNRLDASTYRTVNNIPAVIRNALIAAGHENQIPHFGDNYGTENGWSIIPTYTDDKYPISSISSCGLGAANGRIRPCVNATRSYGETYTGYFVPAQTGVYRFRSATAVDDIVQLLLAPTEYVEDLTPIISSRHTGVADLFQSVFNLLGGSAPVQNGEFAPNAHHAAGHPTERFYEGSVTLNQGSYRPGYVYLKQGNVYAFEIRFQEGGGNIQFSFEYNRKDITCNPTNSQPNGSCWDGWAAIDAAVLVPGAGSDAHTPQVIPVSSNVVNFAASNLFYDAEQDLLGYSARLVSADGTPYVGPGSTSNVSEIGLTLNAQTGSLTGTLNATYTGASSKPRVIFSAVELRSNPNPATNSLPIKFQ